MSGGAVFREALRRLRRRDLPDVAERDVISALEAGRRGRGPLQFVYDAGAEAGLERDEILRRGAGVFFGFCAGNLADDLVDGECVYLDPPVRLGPTVQFILQQLGWEAWLESGATRDDLARAAGLLARAAGAQQVEVRTERWTIDTAKLVAEHAAGLQYAAYLRVLWSGTRLTERAEHVGQNLGITAHVSSDIASGDRRALDESSEDRAVLVAWAREGYAALAREGLACIDAVLASFAPTIGAR